ncbi:hypothetical protein U1Q18_031478 [Sarracenia purpurea var. burkii]
MEVTEAIIWIVEAWNLECMAIEGMLRKIVINASKAIVFTDCDKKYPFPHNRLFYILGFINGVSFGRLFLDGGALVNIMPKKTFDRTNLSEDRIVNKPITILGFGGERKCTGIVTTTQATDPDTEEVALLQVAPDCMP